MGQLLLEDEYVINVKVRRPLDGPCPPPPTFTVACHDSNQTNANHRFAPKIQYEPILQNSNEMIKHESIRWPSNSYIGSFTIGPDKNDESDTFILKNNFPKSITWKEEEESPSPRYDLSKKATSVTMQPGGRKFYPDNLQRKCPQDSGNLMILPQVRVFGEDENLIATNVYKPPATESCIKPTQRGSLYVERIRDHCKSSCGQLYVPPVNDMLLKKDDIDVPMRGNSRRTESERLNAKLKKKGLTILNGKSTESKQTEVARDHLSELLDGCVTYPFGLKMPDVVPTTMNETKHDENAYSLQFPTPISCVPHQCPRNRELTSSVQLTQSCTMFPSCPSAMLKSNQSFNFPSGRTSATRNYLEDSDLTDYEPCYSAVYDKPSQVRVSENTSYGTTTSDLFPYGNNHFENKKNKQFIDKKGFKLGNLHDSIPQHSRSPRQTHQSHNVPNISIGQLKTISDQRDFSRDSPSISVDDNEPSDSDSYLSTSSRDYDANSNILNKYNDTVAKQDADHRLPDDPVFQYSYYSESQNFPKTKSLPPRHNRENNSIHNVELKRNSEITSSNELKANTATSRSYSLLTQEPSQPTHDSNRQHASFRSSGMNQCVGSPFSVRRLPEEYSSEGNKHATSGARGNSQNWVSQRRDSSNVNEKQLASATTRNSSSKDHHYPCPTISFRNEGKHFKRDFIPCS